MKNKKPKTIEDLFKNGFVVTNIVQPYTYEAKKEFIRQIKQLIADEVIGKDYKPTIQTELGNLKFDTTEVYNAVAINKLKRQQRKKLEKL